MSPPAEHEIYIATIRVYSEMRKVILGFKKNPGLSLIFHTVQLNGGHVFWITQPSDWNVYSAAI